LVFRQRVTFPFMKATNMDPFPCLSDTIGTPNSSTKEATVGPNETTSVKRQEGTVNGDKCMEQVSYANMLNDNIVNHKVNFRVLESSVPQEADFDVSISIASVEEVNNRMMNSLYGYFIGKRLAFPVVEMYIRNAWNKYGVQKAVRAPKCVVNGKDKSKGPSVEADNEGFIEVKKKRPVGKNGGNRNFTPVSLKSKLVYRPKEKQANVNDTSPTKISKDVTNEALASRNNKDTTTTSSKKGITSTDGKEVNDLDNEDSDGEVEEIYDVTANFMTINSMANKASTSGSGVGNSCLYERWKETYEDDPYDDADFDFLRSMEG
ncbi:hypothetical protein Tco_1495176, partial [Tanacetum coccineum]